jgi:uncharacterized protein YjiS (DUF1127 family)
MKAKLFATLAAGGASVALVSGVATAATPTGKTETPKSVYFIFTGYAYPYFAPMAEAVTQAASHYPDLTVKIVNANNSASDEIADINEAVAAGARWRSQSGDLWSTRSDGVVEMMNTREALADLGISPDDLTVEQRRQFDEQDTSACPTFSRRAKLQKCSRSLSG